MSTDHTSAARDRDRRRRDATRSGGPSSAVCTGVFMLLLDITIVNVALPDIQSRARRLAVRPAVGDRRLRAQPGRPAAHRRLARRPLRPPAGLRDRHCCVFTLGSIACGAAQDIFFLPDLARLPGHRRRGHVRHRARAAGQRLPAARTAGRRSASSARPPGVAVAIGPVLGGVLTSGLSWRWIFFVNIPICLVAIAVSLTAGPRVEGPARRPPGLVRLRHLLAGARRPRLRPDRGRPGQLGRPEGGALPGRVGGAAGGLRGQPAAPEAPDVRPRRCCASPPSPAA